MKPDEDDLIMAGFLIVVGAAIVIGALFGWIGFGLLMIAIGCVGFAKWRHDVRTSERNAADPEDHPWSS